MISKNLITTVGFASLAFLVSGGLVAQQQTNPSPGTKQQMKAKMQEKMQEKMKGGGTAGQCECEEIPQLMTKLKESIAAIGSEKNPAALQTKIAEHAALLDTLAAKISAQEQKHDEEEKGEGKEEEHDGPQKGKSSK